MRPAEQFWAQPHDAEWVENYAASTFGAHRALLGQALRSVAPFDTALDMGCNCGVLMPWLTGSSQHVKVTGVDVSNDALMNANTCWPQHTWVNESVVDYVQHADSFDVVVSSSCLAHLAPTDLTPTLEAMTRIAKKAVVLQEVTSPQEGQSTSVGVMEWRYDYIRRFAALGWRCSLGIPFGADPTRPGMVMVFTRME